MFTYEERRALTTIMEKLKNELPKVQAEVEEAEEAYSLASDYAANMRTEFAYGICEDEAQRYHDLSDKAQSLKWMFNHLDRFMEELEFIDWLHV